ncbi:UDP-galactopyranose mutase [Sphingomonas panacis]|uniref:UDP-galactopyranose mutase n=1 Tax=Sphingomonas panacis TaxID=1560345 RepID=A0A1B3ZFZ5_9SPHN|nr:UDP-galactopyranose mutase [Sphingomonas panacis]AOH86355.1 UDP-galactopyranose mutase [Sphingomonas panacis]
MTQGNASSNPSSSTLLICFSHLRWDFVFQRPQHLMTRLARNMDVLFWEEPIEDAAGEAWVDLHEGAPGVTVAVPHLPWGLEPGDRADALRRLLESRTARSDASIIRWYYTPMMLSFSRHIDAKCTVYDCMDELANFRFAPPELIPLEQELFAAADLVFTGGYSLYEAKRASHASVHPFPSSVDVAHFARAREVMPDATDQAGLPRPRFGFYGVIDERMNLGLIATLADARPDWSFVMLGPVVKVDPAELPQRPNIAYLGGKSYDELPGYAAGWDVALMPFAINEATRFISPTKTPEYLAAGLPVVSTPIRDVIRHYGAMPGVFVADGAEAFVAACDQALALRRSGDAWRAEADALLAEQSWDQVAARMLRLILDIAEPRRPVLQALPTTHYDYLVVGAGFAGAVMAERLAAGSGKRVLVIDKRPHVAGNAYDHHDAAGMMIHQYGPHIFHTNSAEIVEYLSRFTEWRPYEHRVLAQVGDKQVPIPINRTTLNSLYGLSLKDDADTAAFLAARAEPVAMVRSSEDVVVSAVGRELYETFFRGYTRKQWGIDPSELDKSVTARVPTRTSTDDRYFTDTHQVMPRDGYTAMFEKMLDHPNIDLALGVDFAEAKARFVYDRIVYTGPIDEYFGFRFGKLPYRSLEFRHVIEEREWAQSVAVVNYPDEAVPHTRITEYKHLTGQTAPHTSLTYEYPSDEGDPYYPIPRAENQALYKRYEALAAVTPEVLFVGRLATYRYYNMDQVVGQALATYRRHVAEQAIGEATYAAVSAE